MKNAARAALVNHPWNKPRIISTKVIQFFKIQAINGKY